MKKIITASFLSLSLTLPILSLGCATHNPPSTTPVLSPTATTLLLTSLSALQTAAIALAPVDGIPASDTTTIVNVVSVAVKTIQAGATGWVSAVDILLSSLPGALSSTTADTLSPYLDAIEAVITDLYASGVL